MTTRQSVSTLANKNRWRRILPCKVKKIISRQTIKQVFEDGMCIAKKDKMLIGKCIEKLFHNLNYTNEKFPFNDDVKERVAEYRKMFKGTKNKIINHPLIRGTPDLVGDGFIVEFKATDKNVGRICRYINQIILYSILYKYEKGTYPKLFLVNLKGSAYEIVVKDEVLDGFNIKELYGFK